MGWFLRPILLNRKCNTEDSVYIVIIDSNGVPKPYTNVLNILHFFTSILRFSKLLHHHVALKNLESQAGPSPFDLHLIFGLFSTSGTGTDVVLEEEYAQDFHLFLVTASCRLN
jgi:hypothetical protein